MNKQRLIQQEETVEAVEVETVEAVIDDINAIAVELKIEDVD